MSTRLLALLVAVALGVVAAPVAGAEGEERDPTLTPKRGEQRLALVIGNSAYKTAPLRNPVNDARAIARALRGLGFEVQAHENLTEKAMRRAILEFGDQLQEGGVGLFYYAGHGLQVAGRNSLVPVDAAIQAEREVELEAVDAARVLAKMETAKSRLNIVILDACRNNPFGRSFRSSAQGLAAIDAPTGTLIAYATAPGKVASDGPGANGLYISELLKVMRLPGLKIEDVFKRVRQAVARQTRGDQVPWESSSLVGDFIFALPPAGPVAKVGPPRPAVREEVRQAVGSLAITTKAPGVEGWLGDQKIGETRAGRALVVDDLPVGTYRLRARKAGHKEWEREVQVSADASRDVVIDLDPLGPPPVIKGDDGAEMVLIPGGEFWMGSPQDEVDRVIAECRSAGVSEATCKEWLERELPRHRVTLDAFYLDRTEVTNALFERFVTARAYQTTAEREGFGWAWQQKDGKYQWVKTDAASWRSPNGPGSTTQPTHPVAQVSWHDAQAYCKWAGKRLPTEAEWEKAARGTDGRRYPWGEAWDPAKANGAMTVKTTTAVGAYPAGTSPYGVHDMAGNVSEWVSSVYKPYP